MGSIDCGLRRFTGPFVQVSGIALLSGIAGVAGALCYTADMNEWLPFIALAGLLIGLFAWLRQDIRELGQRVGNLEERMGQLEQRMARLEGLIEGLFRPRPVLPPLLDPDQHDQAA